MATSKKIPAKRKPPVKNTGTKTVKSKNNNFVATNPVQESFKKSVQDIIVSHEVAIAKSKIENELENCGDVYYITQAEKDKMIKTIKDQQAKMAVDFLFLSLTSLFIGLVIGKIIGREKGYGDGYFEGEIEGREFGYYEGRRSIERDFTLTPKEI